MRIFRWKRCSMQTKKPVLLLSVVSWGWFMTGQIANELVDLTRHKSTFGFTQTMNNKKSSRRHCNDIITSNHLLVRFTCSMNINTFQHANC